MLECNRKCCQCGSTSADGVVLYRFPKPGVRNSLRCELWAKYMFPNGSWSSSQFQMKLHTGHLMLCTKHFKEKSFVDLTRKKLCRGAAPDRECDEDWSIIHLNNTTSPDFCIDITNDESSKLNTPFSGHADESDANIARYTEVTERAKSALKLGPSPVIEITDKRTHKSFYIDASGLSSSFEIIHKKCFKVTAGAAAHGPLIPKLSNPLFIKKTNKISDQSSIFNNSELSQPLEIHRKRSTPCITYSKYDIISRKYLKTICKLHNTMRKMENRHSLDILALSRANQTLRKKIRRLEMKK